MTLSVPKGSLKGSEMGDEPKSALQRTSITQRPSTIALLEEMQAASGLSQTDLYNAGIDFLHFAWSVFKSGGAMAYRAPGSEEYANLHIVVPGLIRPNFGK